MLVKTLVDVLRRKLLGRPVVFPRTKVSASHSLVTPVTVPEPTISKLYFTYSMLEGNHLRKISPAIFFTSQIKSIYFSIALNLKGGIVQFTIGDTVS